jgi:hypothetical protein
MHLLILLVSGPIGLAVVTYLVAHYPINRTLRWKGDWSDAERDIADGAIPASALGMKRSAPT